MKKLIFSLLAFVGMTHAAITATFSKNLSAVDSAITMSAGSYNSVSFQLDSTWVATVKFEGTINGTNWRTVYAVNQTGGAVDSVATAKGVYLLSGNGFKLIRARVSARSSGTIKVQAMANEGSGVVSLLNQSSAGASSNVAVTTSALPTGAATSANQTNAAQKTQVVDGSGNVIGATSNALDVNIKSGASSGAVAQGSTTSGQTGGLTQGAVTTAPPTYTTAQTSPLSLTTAGGLRVDGSGTTQPVSGTVAATQSGTWTVQPGNTANTTAWKVDGSAVTQPVSGTVSAAQSGTWNVTNVSGTVSLPTLAATSTKQSDGSQKTQLVDGSNNVIASTANALNVQCANCSGSGVSATDQTTFTPGTSVLAPGGGLYQVGQTSNPVTTGQQGAFQMTRFRALHINLRDSTGAVLGNSTTPLQVSLANTGSNGTAVSVNCSNCSGSGVSATDETTFTPGTSVFVPDGGLYQATQTSNPLTTGQQGAFQATRFRALHVTLRDSTGAVFGSSTTPIQVSLANTAANGTAVKVDGSAVTQPVSIATAPALVASSAVIGKVGIDQTTPGTTNLVALAANQTVNVAQINGVTPLMGNGATGTGSARVTIANDQTAFGVNLAQYTPASGRLPVDPSGVTSPVSYATTGHGTATGALRVELPTDGTGVIATVGAVTAITNALPAGSNALGTVTAVGAAAHGSAISGAPVRQGNRGRTSDITVVSNDQTVDQIATIDGKAVFMPYAIRPSKWFYAPPANGLTSTTAVKAKSGAAGLRVCTTSLQVMTEHQTISTEVVLYASPGAGAATDTLWRGWAQAAGGGAAPPMPVDVCTPNTGDSLKVVEKTATGTNGVLFNLQGYTTAE
jgi:hypothetical protein